MKIKIITFGCSNNIAESEIMSGLLVKAGHSIVDKNEDLTIVNICSVKGPSLNRATKIIKESKVPVVVTGCIPKESVNHLTSFREDISLLNTHNIDKIVFVVENMLNGQPLVMVDNEKKEKVCLPKIRKNKIINIVPISSGCLGNCTYCSVKLIKGNLFSYDAEHILAEVKESLAHGCKEIWLTSQDTGAYGLDIGLTLPELLSNLLSLEGDFMVRLGMTNPQYVLRYLDDLINILKDKKMFKFLHIPLQSGSDKILSDMNRPYSQKDYIKIIKKLKKHHPDLTISTDIIVGFPTETDKDFQDTLECIRSTRPDILNISRYWPRPGTKAAALKQLDGKIVKERSKVLLELFNKISKENNSRWLGWQGSVLIDEVGKDDSFIGRNYAYKPIIVKGRFKLGEKINVKITETTVHDLRGHLMNV